MSERADEPCAGSGTAIAPAAPGADDPAGTCAGICPVCRATFWLESGARLPPHAPGEGEETFAHDASRSRGTRTLLRRWALALLEDE